MKTFAIATLIALGFGTAAAQALPMPSDYMAESVEASESVAYDRLGQPHHDCHGRTTGTAHARCGTLTGGPAGGLF